MQSVLCIASSESCGLAGLAVDLRVAAALGVHAAPIVAAVTAQPARAAAALLPIPEALLRSQLQVALERLQPAAIKIGLLPGPATSALLVEELADCGVPIVVDPVYGNAVGEFLSLSAWRSSIETLLPISTLLTPNLPELRALLGKSVEDREPELIAACGPLLDRGAAAVLVKGGHRSGDADDLLLRAAGSRSYEGERLPGEFRGTGCALSTAITAYLARGRDLETAVQEAREFLRAALSEAIRLADGSCLPHYFFEFYGREGLPQTTRGPAE